MMHKEEMKRGDERGERKNRKVEGEMPPAEKERAKNKMTTAALISS